MGHEIFQDVATSQPLGIGAGGREAAFTEASFTTAVKSNGEYKAAGNLCWSNVCVDYDWPVNPKEIDTLKNFFFKTPTHLPGEGLVVAVGQGEMPNSPNSLAVVSPIETVHALWKAIWRDAFTDVQPDTILTEWRNIVLSTPMKFMLIDDTQARTRMMHQLRENISQQYASLRLSILNKIFNVIAVASSVRPNPNDADPTEVAKLYSGIDYAANSEPITTPFIKTALLVNKMLLSNPNIKSALIKFDADSPPKHALDASNKLDAIIMRTKPSRHLEWSVLLLIDLLESGGYSHESCSLRSLEVMDSQCTLQSVRAFPAAHPLCLKGVGGWGVH